MAFIVDFILLCFWLWVEIVFLVLIRSRTSDECSYCCGLLHYYHSVPEWSFIERHFSVNFVFFLRRLSRQTAIMCRLRCSSFQAFFSFGKRFEIKFCCICFLFIFLIWSQAFGDSHMELTNILVIASRLRGCWTTVLPWYCWCWVELFQLFFMVWAMENVCSIGLQNVAVSF